MRDQAKFLKDISAERICTELTKMIVSKHPERLEEAYELGLTNIFLPEFDRMMQTPQNNPYHLYDVGRHTLQVMRAVSATPVLRYAALLHDVGNQNVRRQTKQESIISMDIRNSLRRWRARFCVG